ncbi:hypothetical protein BOTBODRAFT_61642 [Botryobasidium botryosum FD-172 SS1]|uniref:Uncharacterized protein n=1 Tax=Botryobasidium botryosum (strain FD-172 SS1) TaxID=930990 RepID=A0A067N8Q1_BOTB1|nr:hypothetical protein BOTBODRAFT_61642 [Botryobasidium botryosum FD-172 SS1]
MASFSRLQLAAALLEYDNDPDDPTKPFRSAQESAIFAPTRRNTTLNPHEIKNYNDIAPPHLRRTTDYLGVQLPSEGKSVSGGGSGSGGARQREERRQSVHTLGAPQTEPDDTTTADTLTKEMDLAAWGIDILGRKDDEKVENRPGPARLRAPSEVAPAHFPQLPNPHSPTSPRSMISYLPNPFSEHGHDTVPFPSQDEPKPEERPRPRRHSDFALGSHLVEEEAEFVPPKRTLTVRRHSYANPLDFVDLPPPTPGSLLRPKSVILPSISVPFPASGSPGEEEGNPFKLPPSKFTSRFDPKAQRHSRTLSRASLGPSSAGRLDVPGSGRTVSNASFGPRLLDGKGGRTPSFQSRRMSNTSMGTQMLLDGRGDAASAVLGRNERYEEFVDDEPRLSRMELLRPKVLVMPSPLQGTDIKSEKQIRDGFMLSTDGRPLPPGSRTGGDVAGSSASASIYTPNPRASMSLAQLTFRNTLMVGGERDPSYSDLDRQVPRAHDEGEKVNMGWENEAEEETDVLQENRSQRPSGKLFGRSLIDALETRKAEIRGQQRVFTGDARPSMMERGVGSRNTYFDPNTLNVDPRGNPGGPPSNRRDSVPLLDFNPNNAPGSGEGNRTLNTRSVFGVDPVWDREMEKLRAMEDMDKAEQLEQQQRERELEDKKGGKKLKKGKGKERESSYDNVPAQSVSPELQTPSHLAPPEMNAARPRPRPQTMARSNSNGSDLDPYRRESVMTLGVGGWFGGDDDGSTDEEDRKSPLPQTRRPIPQRKTSGPARRSILPKHQEDEEDDDVPLAVQLPIIAKAKRPAIRTTAPDSEDEQPLSAVLGKKKAQPPLGALSLDSGRPLSEAFGLNTTTPKSPESKPQGAKVEVPSLRAESKNAGGKSGDEDDDEVPLAVKHPRASMFSTLGSPADEDDDDKPLGLRQSMYSVNPMQLPPQQQPFNMMMMQQQQQQQLQQQIIMQTHAQIQNSMTGFSAPMAHMPMFGPQFMPGPFAGVPPPLPNSIAAIPEANKFGRVDKWRRDVVP